jgi:hypothetical protein
VIIWGKWIVFLCLEELMPPKIGRKRDFKVLVNLLLINGKLGVLKRYNVLFMAGKPGKFIWVDELLGTLMVIFQI